MTPQLNTLTINTAPAPPKPHRKRFFLVPIAALAIYSVLPIGGNVPLIAAITGQGASPQLTLIARADGTFDIKEYAKPDQWFAADIIGEALEATAKRRYGHNVKPANVNVMVQADPGINADAVRVALLDAQAKGFTRFGFADPRLGEVFQQVGATPAAPAIAGLTP